MSLNQPTGLQRVRLRTWEIVEKARPGDRASQAFDISILCLIALNVLAVMLGTVRSFEARWSSFLNAFEILSVAVFSAEYLFRVWSSAGDEKYSHAVLGRLRFAVTPMALIDLAAVLPFYLPMVAADLRFLRVFRLLRLVRVAKLGRYVRALQLLGTVLRRKKEELVLTFAVMAVLLVIASSLMYYAENAAQPEAFSSIPASFWWAIATLTTVGYGDVYPVTPVGRVIGSVVAVLGIGLFALPAGLVASGFVEEIQRSRERRRCPHCGEQLG